MIWMVLSLFFSGIVLLIDYIARRKKWKENTKEEKNGLVLTVLFSFPYIFGSFFGLFFGIENYDPSPIEAIIISCGAGISIVSFIATVAALVLRKTRKAKASNWVLIIGFLYCVAVIGAYLLIP